MESAAYHLMLSNMLFDMNENERTALPKEALSRMDGNNADVMKRFCDMYGKEAAEEVKVSVLKLAN